MDIFLVVAIAIIGLVMGSFAGASVWRLRARQLKSDDEELLVLSTKKKRNNEETEELNYLKDSAAERARERQGLDPLLDSTVVKDRSRCLSCGHELAWYDLIPLFSWFSNFGRCRYCKKPIGIFEPMIELGTASLFVGMYAYWNSAVLAIWLLPVLLVIAVLLAILFAYDFKWFLLPDVMVWPFVTLAVVISVYTVMVSNQPLTATMSIGGAVLILSGLYMSLWLVSRGQWVGFGDVKLGLGLAFLLADWQLAFVALFLANLIGVIVVLPGMLSRRLTRRSQVPFGPLLIIGAVITLWASSPVMNVWATVIGAA